MSPPGSGERRGPRQNPATTNTTKTKTLTKEPGHSQCKGPVYPETFREWDALVRERPFGRRWTA